ncbi:MAG TPA: antibiotic biosynthesis monooxygenase family protein [Caulobacteraceae bacterium]|jgi:heme-degrading monooxygenase HmoA|nr:antibiotic biosynthesis monooxygenase family protein [Caulobacteraceae bacterium]
MFTVVWEYEVKPEHVDVFIEAYRPGGLWARLFHRGEGYMGSDLYRSTETPARFVTIDRWRSRELFTEFMVKQREAYASMDAKCDGWTVSEQRLGEIEP